MYSILCIVDTSNGCCTETIPYGKRQEISAINIAFRIRNDSLHSSTDTFMFCKLMRPIASKVDAPGNVKLSLSIRHSNLPHLVDIDIDIDIDSNTITIAIAIAIDNLFNIVSPISKCRECSWLWAWECSVRFSHISRTFGRSVEQWIGWLQSRRFDSGSDGFLSQAH